MHSISPQSTHHLIAIYHTDEFYKDKALFWLLPDEKAKQIINGIYVWKKSKAGEKIDAMDILPTEVFTSEPKKKVFLRLVPDKADGPIALTGYVGSGQ